MFMMQLKGVTQKRPQESMTTFDFSWSIILSIVLFLPLCVFYPTESNDMDFDTQPCLTALYVQLMLRKLVIILVGLMRMRLDSFTFHSETLAVSIPLLLSTGHYKLHTRLKEYNFDICKIRLTLICRNQVTLRSAFSCQKSRF